jgi:4'-phosphopantetheinyl transferase EntD
MSMLEGMFPAGVAICETGEEHDFESLLPEERKAVERAVPRRRREFAGGRHCAREAMRQLGLPALPIPMGKDRSPQWPAGVVGSISHCGTRCVAVAALRSDGFLTLGVDIEAATDLDEDLFETICLPQEMAAIELSLPHRRGWAAKAYFSAKECVFKCQYPLTGLMLGFQDVHVEFDPTFRTFVGRIVAESAGSPAGLGMNGQIREREGFIVTAMAVKSA